MLNKISSVKSSKKHDHGRSHMEMDILPMVTSSLTELYMIAKKYHLHVTGPTFYGDHKTYDGIAEVALEWFDTVAEYMRGHDMTVPCDPMEIRGMSCIIFDSVNDAGDMLRSMKDNLECMIGCMKESYEKGNPTTDSLLQDLEVELNKQLYFIKSSL